MAYFNIVAATTENTAVNQPYEIEARKKQYGVYRDKLLSFKEA